MATTRWAAVASALVATIRATPGYRSPWSTTDATSTPVYHSLEVALTGDVPGRYLVVGWAGDPDGLQDSGTAGQRLRTIGTNRARDEVGVVTCMAVSQSGRGGELADGTVEAVLTDALAVVADVENALRVPTSGPTLGIAAPRMLAQVGRIEYRPRLVEGVTWWVEFDVQYDTRI